MDWQLLAAFVVASTVVLATPGPVMAVVVHNTLRYGAASGLHTVTGVSLGRCCLLMLLLAGLSNPLAPAFNLWLSVAAAIYMAWLALCALGTAMRAAGPATLAHDARPALGGFMVALSNPLNALFYAAFLSQFAARADPPSDELVLLGAIHIGLSVAFGLTFVAVAVRLRRLPWQRRFVRTAHLASALLYASLAAATAIAVLGPEGCREAPRATACSGEIDETLHGVQGTPHQHRI
jgi:threonine/homoserine/homoserine lactone efflux protein